MRFSRLCVIAGLAAAQLAAGLGGYATAATDERVRAAATAADPLVERLEAAALRVISEQTLPAHRFFMLGYRQPIDHLHPWKGSFEQRLTLLHRGEDRPMVLHGSGYNVPDVPFRSEPARLVDGNQISVEHRYFTPSRPQPTDWDRLTIWQSATDYHRIVRALKGVYAGKWLSTGGSKGGMTSVYFRRFYPRDVDATVAYVAPNDVIDSRDVYDRFLDNVGTDPACRDKLTAIQRETLLRRDELVARMTTWAQAQGYTYTGLFGSADRALEFMVVDTAFAFWQYQLQADCATVPAADVSTDRLWAFLDKVDGFAFYTDQGIEPYVPYYFQAGTQLGSPAPAERHLRDLLRYPGGSVPRSFVPADIPMRFRPAGHGRRRHLGALGGPQPHVRLRRERPVERRAVPARARHPRLLLIHGPRRQPRLADRSAAGRAEDGGDRDDHAVGRCPGSADPGADRRAVLSSPASTT